MKKAIIENSDLIYAERMTTHKHYGLRYGSSQQGLWLQAFCLFQEVHGRAHHEAE
jgi:hypothetical protein